MLAISILVIVEISKTYPRATHGPLNTLMVIELHTLCGQQRNLASDRARIKVPASRALAHLNFHGNLVDCDANVVFVLSGSSGRAANV